MNIFYTKILYSIFNVFINTLLLNFIYQQKQQERALPWANLCLVNLACQHSPFLLTFFSLSTPLYTGTLNISFVHLFSSIAQSETPSLRAFPQEKRLLLLTQLNTYNKRSQWSHSPQRRSRKWAALKCKPPANLCALSTPSYLSTRDISRGYVGCLLRRQASANYRRPT